MRIARLTTPTGPRSAVFRDGVWHHLVDMFAADLEVTGTVTSAADAEFLAPVEPRVLIGIAQNLGNNDHVLPLQAWHKSVHTVAGPDSVVFARRDVGTVNIEGELAVVIGQSAADLTPDNALDHVLGFTIANDVTNAEQSAIDEKNFQSKAGVNYTPLGPWIETELPNPENVATTVVVNGVLQAESGSFNLGSSVVDTLVYVTSWLTLEPGDVVMTGAPGTFLPVWPGDLVEITLDGIGTLRNRIDADTRIAPESANPMTRASTAETAEPAEPARTTDTAAERGAR